MKKEAFLLILLGAMFLLVVAVLHSLLFPKEVKSETIIKIVEVPCEFTFHSGTELNEELRKIIDSGEMEDVLVFFDHYTNNLQVSAEILNESLYQKVPITSAFALAWGESRFRPKAVNKNGGNTTDWGLFQLNDGHRDNWTKEELLDIHENTKEGIRYFAYSLKTFNGDLALAIAGYNRGVENIKRRRDVPYTTIVHINNIIEYDRMLEVSLNNFIRRWNDG